jgi:hypothetical protein
LIFFWIPVFFVRWSQLIKRIKLKINFICRGKGINIGVEKNSSIRSIYVRIQSYLVHICCSDPITEAFWEFHFSNFPLYISICSLHPNICLCFFRAVVMPYLSSSGVLFEWTQYHGGCNSRPNFYN